MKHLNIRVIGNVQRVNFRTVAKDVADQMGIKGFTRNTTDGDVFIEAEADEETLGKFLFWCLQGPDKAKVTRLSIEEAPIKEYTSFEITK